MAKVTFIGDGRDDPAKLVMFGHIFPLGQAVTVEDPYALAKLMGNTHFRVDDAPPIIGTLESVMVKTDALPPRRGPDRPPKIRFTDDAA